MAAELLSAVLVDGKWLPAGTPATAELRKKITNPAAWSESEKQPSKSEK